MKYEVQISLVNSLEEVIFKVDNDPLVPTVQLGKVFKVAVRRVQNLVNRRTIFYLFGAVGLTVVCNQDICKRFLKLIKISHISTIEFNKSAKNHSDVEHFKQNLNKLNLVQQIVYTPTKICEWGTVTLNLLFQVTK